MAIIAFNGLCVGISTAFLLSILSQSFPSEIDGAVQAPPQGGPAAQAIPLAVATFFTAVTFFYVHLRHGGRRIPEVMLFILCGSTTLVDLSLSMQRAPVQAPALGAAVAQVLPPVAVATFFLAVTLIYYAHGHGHAAGAANQQNPAAVELLNKVTLAATLITGVLGLIAAVLFLNPE